MPKKVYILKTTTNSCNEDVNSNWEVFLSDEDFKAWKAAQVELIRKWNFDTPGANSFRYMDIQSYTIDDFKNETLGFFIDMPLHIFLNILQLNK